MIIYIFKVKEYKKKFLKEDKEIEKLMIIMFVFLYGDYFIFRIG